MADPPIFAVVDDDQFVRTALLKLIQAFGYRACVFPSAEALLKDDPGRFAGVISDLKMPGLSGLDLIARLHLSHPAVPVIVMSAFADQRMRQQALDAGACAFIEKPCEAETLLHHLQTSLKHG